MKVATSPHDFKLMVAAGGKPRGEGQPQGPGAISKVVEAEQVLQGITTVAPPTSSVPAAAPGYQSAPPPGF
jgi:hypothetical protein